MRTGDKVRHKAFGDGIVVNCIASGDDYEATVAFKAAGVKTSAAKHCSVGEGVGEVVDLLSPL